MIVFPTSPTERCVLGEPLPAKACRCPNPLVDDEGGCFCGHWTHATIRATWRLQARRMATQAAVERLTAPSPGLVGVGL